MFKITQTTLRYFTLAEILLMAAANQREAGRKLVEGDPCSGEADVFRKSLLGGELL